MELEAFGKTIEFELNSKNIKIISIVISVVLVLGIGTFLIYPKIEKILSNKKNIENITVERDKKKNSYLKEKKKVDRLNNIYLKQKEDLELLQKKFERASLTDVLDLKIAVQKIMDYLDLKVIEIGKTETIETKKKGYIKKYIPYTIIGEMDQIGKLFYYLENSKNWLLTFSGNGFNITSSNKKNKLQVKFKIGAYIKKGE